MEFQRPTAFVLGAHRVMFHWVVQPIVKHVQKVSIKNTHRRENALHVQVVIYKRKKNKWRVTNVEAGPLPIKMGHPNAYCAVQVNIKRKNLLTAAMTAQVVFLLFPRQQENI